MSLAGLLGRGFHGPAVGAIAVPSLAVTDNGDGTGAIATIAGSTPGATNTVRTAAFTRTALTLNWSDAGSRTGDGTVALSLAAGAEYLAVVVSELGEVVQISQLVGFEVTANTTFDFNDLRRHVLTHRSVSTEFFGETVTYRIPTRDDVSLKIHADHSVKEEFDASGNEIVIEQLKIKVNRTDIANAPDLQHAIRRAGEARDYLYAFSGKHDVHCYHATFERRYRRSIGLR
jgi:hypothetical protein